MPKPFPVAALLVSFGLAPFLGCSPAARRGGTTGSAGGGAGSSGGAGSGGEAGSGGSSGSAGSAGSGASAGSGGTAGSIGEAGSGGAAGSAAGAGGSVDAGAAGGPSGNADAGVACATAGYKLCDDFEGPAPGAAGSDWTIIKNGGYTMTVDTTQAHSGTHAAHANFGASGGYAYISETKTFPATDWWGRAWMRFMAPKGGHQVFAGSDTSTSEPSGEQMRFLNDINAGTIVMNIRSTDKTMSSGKPIPMGTWNCYEWHQTATKVDLYLDGTMISTATGAGWNGLASTYVAMVLGAERFGGGAAGDVWIDDVAVNNTQVNCN